MNKLDYVKYRRKSFFGDGVDEIDLEQDRTANFKLGHVCPDLKQHHNVKFKCEISTSNASGIGENTYIKCLRCGCEQDATDYNIW